MPNSNKPEDHTDIPKIEMPQGGFQSNLPPQLLHGRTDSEVYILEQLSKISQFHEWAGPILVDSNRQQRKTNGRVNYHEAVIKNIEENLKNIEKQTSEDKEVITVMKTVIKVMKSKYFWIGVGVFFIFILPWITSHAPKPDAVIKLLLGIL